MQIAPLHALKRIGLSLFLVGMLSGANFLDSLFAPKADLWQRWQVEDAASTVQINHQPWQDFLTQFVQSSEDGINRVAYKSVDDAARAKLDEYLKSISQVSVKSLNASEQLALWLNLYNALTVRLILDHYPVKSIRDIKLGGFFSSGPWVEKLFEIDGTEVSLNDIEHRILRPIWKDARLHYGVNCASLGCPNLLKTAFSASNTNDLLDKAARAFINHPRAAAIVKNKLVLSSIYSWFEGDFLAEDKSVLTHLRKYMTEEKRTTFANRRTISDYAYDWDLNDAGSK